MWDLGSVISCSGGKKTLAHTRWPPCNTASDVCSLMLVVFVFNTLNPRRASPSLPLWMLHDSSHVNSKSSTLYLSKSWQILWKKSRPGISVLTPAHNRPVMDFFVPVWETAATKRPWWKWFGYDNGNNSGGRRDVRDSLRVRGRPCDFLFKCWKYLEQIVGLC